MTTIHTAGVTTTAETNYCRPLANTLHSYNKQTNKQTNKQANRYVNIMNKPGLKLLRLAVLNARSIKNKTLQIKDYIVDNDIDIMVLIETWLKDHENCEFVTRDICPSGYMFFIVPRKLALVGELVLYSSTL